jgi:hypothetical protein
MNQPTVFISCVSSEFRQTRGRIAAILTRLGYTPVFQDIFGTEPGDLRQVLRDKIDACEGLIQIVGQAVAACRNALEVYTREQLPQQWAMTQNNLGIALQNQGIRTGGAQTGFRTGALPSPAGQVSGAWGSPFTTLELKSYRTLISSSLAYNLLAEGGSRK